MKKFLVDLGWTIAAVVAAFALWMAAAPARAADPMEPVVPVPLNFPCLGDPCVAVLVPVQVMNLLAQNTNEMGQQVIALQKRARELEANAPKCAEVTVTEPSKAPKLPFIPREPVDGGKS